MARESFSICWSPAEATVTCDGGTGADEFVADWAGGGMIVCDDVWVGDAGINRCVDVWAGIDVFGGDIAGGGSVTDVVASDINSGAGVVNGIGGSPRGVAGSDCAAGGVDAPGSNVDWSGDGIGAGSGAEIGAGGGAAFVGRQDTNPQSSIQIPEH